MMLIEAPSGVIEYETFTFPDGQPHVKLLRDVPTGERITITSRVRTPADLFELLLLRDVLGWDTVIDVNLLYLMGGRMDRAIDKRQPCTLDVTTDLINDCFFNEVRVLDPHSDRTTDLLPESEVIYPLVALKRTLEEYSTRRTVIVMPDAGATSRVNAMLSKVGRVAFTVVQGLKHRDSQTGKLSGFGVDLPDFHTLQGKHCLIIDDICDGGGTFAGLSAVLREHGAVGVDLFITHGIFSKGLPIEGIDRVHTTDSYSDQPYNQEMYPSLDVHLSRLEFPKV